MKKKIGVIGLGTMGFGIASNLLSSGYEVKGYDIAPACVQRLVDKGGIGAESPAQAAADVEALVLMVFNANQINDVLFGKNGAAAAMRKGSSVLITASVGYQICESVDARLSSMGIHLVDSPVRGSAATAATGELYLMVGASDEAYACNKELIHTLGSSVIHVGTKPGMGQKAKTCMQAFFSLMFEGTYELLALGTAAGLDTAKVFQILNETGASNNIFRSTAQNVAKRQFTNTGNPLSILDKDMKIACETAQNFNLSIPALEGVQKNFAKSMESYASEDVWAAMKTIEASAGLTIQFDYPQD